MRGKTNIPPRLRPVINGDVQNFVVASGNTIAKGDFVSYVLASNSRVFDARDLMLDYKYEYDTTNHKYVAVFKVYNVTTPVIMLLQVVQGQIVILDSETVAITQSYIGASVDGTNIYIGDCPANVYGAVGQTLTVKHFQIVNDEITFVQDYSHHYSPPSPSGSTMRMYTYFQNITVVGTKLYIGTLRYIYPNSGSSGKTSEARIIYTTLGVDFSSNSYKSVWNTSGQVGAKYFSYVYGSKIVYVCTQTSNNVEDVYVKLYDTTQKKFIATASGSYLSSTLINLKEMRGTKLCITTTTRLIIYDISGDTFTELYVQPITSPYFSGWIGDDKYVVVYSDTVQNKLKTREVIFGNEVTVLENDITGTITQSVQTSESIFSNFVEHCILVSTNNPESTNEYPATDDSEIGFIVGEPTNYVREYSGGYTVGFAKTGGNAGSVIQVYIPHNNS